MFRSIALCAFLSGCASLPPGMSAEAVVGAPLVDGGFYGHGPTATLRLRQAIGDRTFCEYEHVSYLLAGPPFGPRSEEDSLDHVGCGIRFGGGSQD